MTSRRKSEDEKEGILEEMLRSLRTIGTNVEEILDKGECCHNNKGSGRYDNEWTPEELYNNGDY